MSHWLQLYGWNHRHIANVRVEQWDDEFAEKHLASLPEDERESVYYYNFMSLWQDQGGYSRETRGPRVDVRTAAVREWEALTPEEREARNAQSWFASPVQADEPDVWDVWVEAHGTIIRVELRSEAAREWRERILVEDYARDGDHAFYADQRPGWRLLEAMREDGLRVGAAE